MDMRSYGERIRDLRTIRNISQKDLAEKIGITQASMSDLERSTHPPLNRVEQVCNVLEIEVWEFFIDETALAEKYDIPAEYIQLIQKLMETPEEFRIKMLTMITEFTEMWLEKKD